MLAPSRQRLGRILRALALAPVASALVAGARDARADDPSVAAATVLFDEGVKLLDEGKVDEACSKLARSQALAPSGGTLLVLGECYERSAKIASAWLAFREAAIRAANAGKRDAEAGAIERARKLEPRLPRLTVVAPNAPQSPGLEVRRDGVLLKEPELGVAVPVDPGPHDIVASAPKRKTWTFTYTATEAKAETIGVPALALADGVAGPDGADDGRARPGDGDAGDERGKTQRTIGLVLAGVGAAGLVAGGVFGLMASSTNDDALSHCTTTDPVRCDAQGLSLTDDAKSKALVSTILFVAGGVTLGAGGVLFFTAPSGSAAAPSAPQSGRSSLSVTPTWGRSGAGAAATLRW